MTYIEILLKKLFFVKSCKLRSRESVQYLNGWPLKQQRVLEATERLSAIAKLS